MSDQNDRQNNHQGSHQNSRQHNHPHRRYSGEGKKATVIIPNYNGLSFMKPCFKALELQICRGLKVLVVDSGSTNGSIEWLEDRGMASIFLDSNTGFSGAMNRGIRAAPTPYVVLLNNDTEPDCHYVGEIIKAIERSPRVFFVGNKMIQMYHKELIDDMKDMCSLLSWAFQRGVGRSSAGCNKAYRASSACAGAAIYRREIFDEIGYFNEMCFAYPEDADVDYRARIVGYDGIYCPSAVVYRVGSGTSGSKYNSLKVRLAVRNNVCLNYKNMPALQLAVNLLPIMAGIVVKYMFFRKISSIRDCVGELKEGITTAGTCRKVPHDPGHLRNYFAVEQELLTDTLIYLCEFTARQIAEL